jgi:hypothetical protein
LTELHGRIAAIPSVDADAVYRGYLSRTVTRAPRGSPSLVRNMGHRRRLLHRHERCLSLPSLSAWRWAPLRAWSTVPSVSGGAHVHGQGGAHGAARRSWISATSMTSLRHTRGHSNLGPPSSGPSSPAGGTWENSDSLPSRTVALAALRRVRHRTDPPAGLTSAVTYLAMTLLLQNCPFVRKDQLCSHCIRTSPWTARRPNELFFITEVQLPIGCCSRWVLNRPLDPHHRRRPFRGAATAWCGPALYLKCGAP